MYLFCRKVFSFNFWNDLKHYKHPDLIEFANNLPSIAQASISSSTNRSFSVSFCRIKVWCENYNLSALPASVTTIAIYLSYLIQKQLSKSVFVNAFYAIK